MKLDNLFVNWKTTSAGLLSLVAGLTRLSFAISNKTFDEETVMACATTFLLGLGLLFARDVNVTSADLGLQEIKPKSEATDVVTPNEEDK